MKTAAVIAIISALAAPSLAAPEMLAKRESRCDAGLTICGRELTQGYPPAPMVIALESKGWQFGSATMEGLFKCLGNSQIDYVAPCLNEAGQVAEGQCAWQDEGNGNAFCSHGTASRPTA